MATKVGDLPCLSGNCNFFSLVLHIYFSRLEKIIYTIDALAVPDLEL